MRPYYFELTFNQRNNMKTLIELQECYIETLNAGIARWSHRKDGGHSARIARGARRKAETSLRKCGYSQGQIDAAIKDARDMAVLLRIAEVD
jgi:hypothetical protein